MKTIQQTLKEYKQMHLNATAQELQAVIDEYTAKEVAEKVKNGII